MARNNDPDNSTSAARIASECLAVRVRQLSRTITGIYDEALRPLGITVGQLNILVVVAHLGPISPGEVARLLSMEKSTVSRNVERMRLQGWLTVSAGESGRSQLLGLDRKGKSILERARPRWEEAQGRTESLLGQRGSQAIHRAADAVRARL